VHKLQLLQSSGSLEVNRGFFSLFEALLGLDAVSNSPGTSDAQGQSTNAEIRISNLPGHSVSPFLARVCKILEPHVIKWISNLSDQLLRFDQSLVVSLSKQTPTPGLKSRMSRSLRDLFDGIVRSAGSENAKLVYRSAPRYAALLDKVSEG
jgi:hypothetical protein